MLTLRSKRSEKWGIEVPVGQMDIHPARHSAAWCESHYRPLELVAMAVITRLPLTALNVQIASWQWSSFLKCYKIQINWAVFISNGTDVELVIIHAIWIIWWMFLGLEQQKPVFCINFFKLSKDKTSFAHFG